jgi:hypothetical protein
MSESLVQPFLLNEGPDEVPHPARSPENPEMPFTKDIRPEISHTGQRLPVGLLIGGKVIVQGAMDILPEQDTLAI